jgi:elongation factor Tu
MSSDPVLVSAADGPLPQTVDQLKALAAQGATSVDVVITNTDLVSDAELLELVELEVRDLVAQHGLTLGSMPRDGSGATDPGGLYGPPS